MIIFDLDGTLADCEHRRHLIAKNPRSSSPRWEEFFRRAIDDTPIEPVAELYRLLRSAHRDVRIWSGRSDVVRVLTLRWFKEHIALGNDLLMPSDLLMRPAQDFTPDDQLKEQWLKNCPVRPLIVFDDRQKVVDMWRRNGIQCAQVAPGDF